MKPVPNPLRRQRGAIAIMFGLTLVVLLAAGGLVIDLGHLYVLKSELQNGADSAALAGAKEINMTGPGINLAAAKAIAFAGKNKFNFANALTLTNANIAFSSGPDGPWLSVADAAAAPAGKTFIKVDTGNKSVSTYLMGVAGIPTVATAGVAVAGRFVVDITPLGICAVDPLHRLNGVATAAPVENELREFGFRRGTTYDMLKLKNIAGTSDPMLINPVDSPPTACQGNHSSANFTAPFLCQGNSAVTNNASTVYVNTGVSAGPVEQALNSRFNLYAGSACVAASAPPDQNIREYKFDDVNYGAAKWMSPAQTAQSQPIDASGVVQPTTSTTLQGVLWSYSRPVRALGSTGNFSAGSAFSIADWPKLYTNNVAFAANANYPSGATDSPYTRTVAPFFLAPPTNIPTANRRLMNLAILDCTIPAGNGACHAIPLLGVGRFFLQRQAKLNGGAAGLWVEFAGLIEPVPNSEIKLYR